jgi:hypothetical protein
MTLDSYPTLRMAKLSADTHHKGAALSLLTFFRKHEKVNTAGKWIIWIFFVCCGFFSKI